MQYTEEQIIRANQTDLVSFLSAQGEQLGKSGKEYRWKKHDSVTVSGNRWYRHSQEYGSYIKPSTLDLTYSGEKLIGKTVSFQTEDVSVWRC